MSDSMYPARCTSLICATSTYDNCGSRSARCWHRLRGTGHSGPLAGLGKEPAAAPVERRVLPRGVVAHQVAPARVGEPVEARRWRTGKPSEIGHVRTTCLLYTSDAADEED